MRNHMRNNKNEELQCYSYTLACFNSNHAKMIQKLNKSNMSIVWAETCLFQFELSYISDCLFCWSFIYVALVAFGLVLRVDFRASWPHCSTVVQVMEAAQASTGLVGPSMMGSSLHNVNHIAHLSGALIGAALVLLISRISFPWFCWRWQNFEGRQGYEKIIFTNIG